MSAFPHADSILRWWPVITAAILVGWRALIVLVIRPRARLDTVAEKVVDVGVNLTEHRTINQQEHHLIHTELAAIRERVDAVLFHMTRLHQRPPVQDWEGVMRHHEEDDYEGDPHVD